MLDNQHVRQYTSIPVTGNRWSCVRAACPGADSLRPLMTFCHSHYHPDFEILVIAKGEAVVSINGEAIHAGHGDILLINPYDVHYGEYYTACEEFEYYCLCFSLTLLGSEKNREYTDFVTRLGHEQLKYRHLVPKGSPMWQEIEPYVRRTYGELQTREAGWELAVRGRLFLLFSVLRRHLAEAARVPDAASVKNEAFVRQVLTYVEEHYQQPISTRDIAAVFSYNENYFCRLFRRQFSRSFGDYLNSYRTQRARELLTQERLSVAQVAAEVGFGNFSYFSRLFREQTGMSPSEYRRQKGSLAIPPRA